MNVWSDIDSSIQPNLSKLHHFTIPAVINYLDIVGKVSKTAYSQDTLDGNGESFNLNPKMASHTGTWNVPNV